MGRSSKESVKRLYAIASGQQGYFTTKQAIKAGYPDTVHSYHLRNEDWIRCRRGIYRLNRYPEVPQGDLVVWSLWSRGRDDRPQGVFSHETALAIHGFLGPRDKADKLHMTVPPKFRKLNGIPEELVVYYDNLNAGDVDMHEGYGVTTLARTIFDLEARDDSGNWAPDGIRQELLGRPDVQKIMIQGPQRAAALEKSRLVERRQVIHPPELMRY